MGANPYVVGGATGAASGAAMGGMATGTPMGAAVGGAVGLGVGLLGASGQRAADKAARAAQEAQERAVTAEMRARAQGQGEARATFGDINSFGQKFNGGTGFARMHDPTQFQDIGKTLQNRSVIQGGIDQQASAVRDAGRLGLTGAAGKAGANIRAASAGRGLMGSSIDQTARQGLVGSYAGGRADLAGQVQATRQGSWDAIRGQQNAFEGAAASGGRIGGQLGSLSTLGTIAGARAQQPVAAMGNMLNLGLNTLNRGMVSEAQGGQGLQALGLPGMGLGSNVSGATTARTPARRMP